MKAFSPHGWLLATYCAGVSIYFSAACLGRWPSPFQAAAAMGSSFNKGGSGGSSYSRSFGGSWGGGK